MSIESFVIEIIEGKKKVEAVRSILYGLSLFFHFGSYLRNKLYDIGLLYSVKLSKPVISIGNIVAGGTGKTPFVAMLGKHLSSKKIAIISRGYRSQGKGIRCVSKGEGPLLSAFEAGDEPYWLAKQLPAQVWVGKNRKKSSQQAILEGAELLLLEDGFQHRQIKRNLDIVLLHAEDLWGRGYFLPRGYLRDLPQRLSSAHCIGVTYLDSNHNKGKIEQEIRRFSSAPIIGFSASYQGQEDRIQGKKVGLFCGIAKPNIFYRSVENLGAKIVQSLVIEDHKVSSEKELEAFAKECKDKGAEVLVCTEKDWVKLSFHERLALPVYVLQMQFVCVWNENLWHELCQKMENL